MAAAVWPRLSRRAGFWVVAFAFLAVSALSTAPSSLYGLYEHRLHLASITLTIVYAVYALGIVTSLVLVGHLSDWYGRRPVLLPALGTGALATVVFLVWRSLAGLLVARVLTGLALGAALATATAFITDLDGVPGEAGTRRAGIVATSANIGGLALGPLIAGLVARYAGVPLTTPFVVLLVALVAGTALVALSPEGHPAIQPRPKYHPQRLAAPPNARRQFAAAATGVLTAFSVGGLFAGLAGTYLARSLHHPSPALTGLTIFLTFGAGVLVQTTTTRWAAHRLVAAGIAPLICGLALLVVSAWTSPPSLALFLTSAFVAGAGVGAITRGSLTVAISASDPDARAGALVAFFTAGYIGVSLPVVGLGLALQDLSPRVTLLLFGLIVGLVILAAAPVLVRPADRAPREAESSHAALANVCRCLGAVDDADGDLPRSRQPERISSLPARPRFRLNSAQAGSSHDKRAANERGGHA